MTVDGMRTSTESRDAVACATPEVDHPATGLSPDDALSLLAHDMRASMTVVLGFAHILRDGWGNLRATQIQASLDAIIRRADDVVAFSDDLLAMSRAEAGRLELWTEPVDLGDLLTEEIARMRGDDLDHVFHLRTDPSPLAWGDRRRLGQVVANLLSNAARSAPPGTAIEVAARMTGDGPVVLVADRGPGVPPEVAPRLFQKFAGLRPHGGSVGLGLYLCRLIVEAHGGRIWTTRAGDRTIFAFTVPGSRGR